MARRPAAQVTTSKPPGPPGAAPERSRARRRARRLSARGRFGEARAAYAAILAQGSPDADLLLEFGRLLHRTEYRQAARTLFEEAARRDPNRAEPWTALGAVHLSDGASSAAEPCFRAALARAPDDRDAHQGLADCLQHLGRDGEAQIHRLASFTGRPIAALPFWGARGAPRVLVLASTVGGNLPTGQIVDGGLMRAFLLMVEADHAGLALPRHDVLFNAVGDADLCAQALRAAAAVAARSAARIVNPPGRVAATGRAGVLQALGAISGVRVPRAVQCAPSEAMAKSAGFEWPLLARSLGRHGGDRFEQVDRPEDLLQAVQALGGSDLLLLERLQTKGPDGLRRKYRVMMIGGRLYPVHLAVSSAWKVHYATSDMAVCAAHRREEQRFLNDMAGALGARAMTALQAIAEALGLDYAGVDFGLAATGDILLFEANATMLIASPGEDPIWAYRKASAERALSAARALIIDGPVNDRS